MTDLRGYIERLKELKTRLEKDMPDILLITATTNQSIVQNRSQDQGILVNAEAGNYVQYSDKQIPTFFLFNKARNQAGRDYIKKNKLGTYGDFRKAQGLSNTNINATYTGKFWASLGPGLVSRGITGFSLDIMVRDSFVMQYAPYLAEKYGDFTDPTEAEAEQSSIDMVDLLVRTCNQYL